jgi:phosphatidylglycerophosphate synthase
VALSRVRAASPSGRGAQELTRLGASDSRRCWADERVRKRRAKFRGGKAAQTFPKTEDRNEANHNDLKGQQEISSNRTMATRFKFARHIPNALSLYRLLMAPVIAAIALAGHESVFVVLIVISLATDVLDGLIARVFGFHTAFGARLDSIADDATYVAAFVGIFVFKTAEFGVHFPLLIILIAMLLLSTFIPFLKFGRFPSFHLYSFKIGGYLQAGFLFLLFIYGFNVYAFYFVVIFGVLACLEVIAVAMILEHPTTNVRGLYWILRERRRANRAT